MILTKKIQNSKLIGNKPQKEKQQDILISTLNVSDENKYLPKNLSEEMKKNYKKKLIEMYNLFSERIY
jgi:hypothetical protein